MDVTLNKKSVLIILFLFILTTNTISAQEDNINDTTDATDEQYFSEIINENTYDQNSTDLDDNDNSEVIYITEDNYKDYEGYDFKNNSTLIINESLHNFELYIEDKNDIKILGNENVTLYNSVITIYMGNVSISNLTFVQNDSSEYKSSIEILTDNCLLDNLSFIDNRTTMGKSYNIVHISGDNNRILNSNFNSTLPAIRVRWVTYFDESKSIVLYMRGNNNSALNNNFNIQESERELPYGMIVGISSYGNGTTIANNNIFMNGTLYLYGIRVVYHDNNVTNNTIRVLSQRYGNAISLDGESSNNIVDDNDIYIQTQNVTIDDEPLIDAGYGIIITEIRYKGGQYRSTNTKTINNIITNNKVYGNSSHMYGIEQFGGTNTEISNNVINVTGYMPMAIGIIGNNTQITNNILIAQGQSREIGESADYIKPRTSGITDTYGSNTYISGNYFFVENGTIAGLDAAKNVTFIENTLKSNSEDNFKLRGYSDYNIDDERVNNIDSYISNQEISQQLEEELGQDYVEDYPADNNGNLNDNSKTDESPIYENINSNSTITDEVPIITENNSREENPENPIIISDNDNSQNNDTITHEDIPEIHENPIENTDIDEEEPVENNTKEEIIKINSTSINTTEDNNNDTTLPLPQPSPNNNTNKTENENMPMNQTLHVTNTTSTTGEEIKDTSDMESLESTEVYNVQVESKSDDKNSKKSSNNPPELELTATVGKTSKVFEVTPKVIEKTITLDNIKYALTFLLIILASLSYGYKRNELK